MGDAEQGRALHEMDRQVRWEDAQRLANLGAWIWDAREQVLTWWPQMYRIFGLDPDAGPLEIDAYWRAVHEDDRDLVAQAIGRLADDLAPLDFECRVVRPDGEVRWLYSRAEATADDHGRLLHITGFGQDVTERHLADRRRLEAQERLAWHEAVLERIARSEPMTDTLTASCRQIEEIYPEARCSVLLVDPAGDVLHHAAAPSLPDAARDALEGMAVAEGMGACGTAAFRRETVVVADTLTDPLTAAFVLAERGQDASGLVRDADAAMYATKDAGRARHVLFDDGLRQRAISRVTLESELRRGIERDEFVMHYQPIFDVRAGTWRGAEALARWQHPSRGLLTPDEFIPLAEETGLITVLGLRLVDRVLSQAATWVRMGLKVPVAANLSVVQLSDPDFPEELGDALVRHGVPPELLLVEVTETGVMERLEVARGALERISALGVRILIDDFGTGYSSIARLRELPVVGVKVDRAFTQHLGEETSVGSVLAAITDLAHALELTVVAEGIETPPAAATASDLGCDFLQGCQLARPVPPEAVATLMAPPP